MSQKKRSVTLSNTVYEWLEVLVSTGEYSDLNDAATYLLMQVKRGTHLNGSHLGAIEASTTPVLTSTTPVLTSTDLKVLTSTTPVLTSTHLNGSHLGAIEASTTPVLETPESPEAELSRLRSLKPMERMKNSVRIEQLKTLLES